MIGWEAFILDLYDPESRTITELICYDTFDGEIRRAETTKRSLKFSEITRRVVEEASLLSLNKTVLEDMGYRVLEAATGVAAREVWAAHKSDIDLLLTDVVMPGGVNGCELAQGILAERPDLPVVFVSGYNKDVLDASLKMEYGFNFLAKPFRPKELLDTVDQRLSASRDDNDLATALN